MAITIVTDLVDKTFLNNPINLRVTSDRSIDFDQSISAVADNGGKVRLTATLVTGSPGQALHVGDTIRLSGFTASDNLYLNELYTNITAIGGSGPYTIDTEIDYVTSATVAGSPKYYRENNNFEIKTTVKLKFGSGGTYAEITGPTSRSIDGVNFDFDFSKYLKLLYDQNVGSNETNEIVLPVTSPYYHVFDLPIGLIEFDEYFDDSDGLQTVGASATSSSAYLHDGVKMPNDIIDKSNLIIDGTSPNITGIGLSRIKNGLSRTYFSIDFISFITGISLKLTIANGQGTPSASVIYPIFTAYKKHTLELLTSYMDLYPDARFIDASIYLSSAPNTIFWTDRFYLIGDFCPGYLVKFKNDLGGWEQLSCGLVNRELSTEQNDWEKKLSFPYLSTDYGSKNQILRSDDYIELETAAFVDISEVAPLFETEYVTVYDIANDKNMHGRIVNKTQTIDTLNSENVRFKVQLNRRR